MVLEKKLGVWGKDKIVGEDDKFHAKDYYCVRCYDEKKETPAEMFFGISDPDCSQPPYCRKCIDYLRMEVMISMEDFGK